MTDTEGLMERVMDGRVFKKVAAFCGKKIRSKDPHQQALEVVNADYIAAPNPVEESISTTPLADSVTKNKSPENIKSNRSRLRSHDDTAGDDFMLSISDFISYPQDIEMQDDLVKPQLTARNFEIFSVKGRDGDIQPALSLTETMVWQWNEVFRYEAKIDSYKQIIEKSGEQKVEIEAIIAEITQQIDDTAEQEGFDHGQIIQQLRKAQDIEAELYHEREEVEINLQRAKENVGTPMRQLFSDWREVLATNNLLNVAPEESEDRSATSNSNRLSLKDQTQLRRRATYSASEVAKRALVDAQDTAIDGMKEKQHQLKNARHKLDHWTDYYDEEYAAYCECVDEGRMEPARTMFDNVLLEENQDATRKVIQAEEELETARRLVRDLGVTLHGSMLESGFGDHADDGYRVSEEKAVIEHVDRDKIQKWMSEDDDGHYFPTDCDEWESKTIDLCDSVSVVAEGKDRKRIDHWRLHCELLEIDAIRGSDEDSST